jgi:hypothetical protein
MAEKRFIMRLVFKGVCTEEGIFETESEQKMNCSRYKNQ